jgi:hypothetical protein
MFRLKSTRWLAILVLALSVSSCFKRENVVDPALEEENSGIDIGGAPSISRTASFPTFAQILDSMTTVTGTTPSAGTDAIYDANRTSFPLEGRTGEVTSGMWMSVSALAGSVCDDLYTKESGESSAARTYYGGLNLGTSSTGFATRRDQIIRGMALGFWDRYPTTAEESTIRNGLSDAGLLNASNAQDTRDALLFICTAELASLPAIEY